MGRGERIDEGAVNSWQQVKKSELSYLPVVK